MKKKILYAILICFIIAGIVVIVTMGLKADIVYSKNTRIDIDLGKQAQAIEIKQIVKDAFGTDRVLVQNIEYFNDMFSVTISQDIDNFDAKVDDLVNKLNEKYELKLTKDNNIFVFKQSKINLFSLLTPYIAPVIVSICIIVVYALIRFRKLEILKTLALYVLTLFTSEAVYLSILAIFRIPVNRLAVPIGLAIYVVVVTVLTVIQEKKLAKYRAAESKK